MSNPRRTNKQILRATALTEEAEEAIRKAKSNPGIDYTKTIDMLLEKGFMMEDIQDVMGITEKTIARIHKGKTPNHTAGERLYTLFELSYNKDPEGYECGKVPRTKPPIRPYQAPPLKKEG